MALARGKTRAKHGSKGKKTNTSQGRTDCSKQPVPGFELRSGNENTKAQQFSYYCRKIPSETTVSGEA